MNNTHTHNTQSSLSEKVIDRKDRKNDEKQQMCIKFIVKCNYNNRNGNIAQMLNKSQPELNEHKGFPRKNSDKYFRFANRQTPNIQYDSMNFYMNDVAY